MFWSKMLYLFDSVTRSKINIFFVKFPILTNSSQRKIKYFCKFDKKKLENKKEQKSTGEGNRIQFGKIEFIGPKYNDAVFLGCNFFCIE